MRSHEEYGIIMKHDCDRYAMKREVAADLPVFPWSMSDFKPGDRYFGTEQATSAPFCPDVFLCLSRINFVSEVNPVFSVLGRNTRNSVRF